ncbi:rRNA processing/ribosome biogenesis-domain-containing protein [Bombardia bombarda]|uniref:Pre-rRNA-processing protein RIX1 n=1 Tax=Bombardia bombarda TaxID=252184 RepID=A0AA39WT80_9PEZI|nr:rRNA processing/ribosome biogenesis-domain-containing protein [Bombardia bombarda]
MSVSPPDLRVLCRRLASTPADELPRLCPMLVGHVLRCGGVLSSVQEAKGKDKLSETPVLVHRLKTHITTLLSGKNASGRFAAISLVKAVIDVGGWECLKASDAWIRGLISILQKPDPLVSKELCVITLTRIYTLLQSYQTLVREMVTPTLPSFVTACLQLIKAPASSKPLKTPVSFVDTITCALSKIVTLYPTTMRPFNSQIRTAIRSYIAPTSADPLVVPQRLRKSSRHLSILLHYTAAKNGSSDDWVRAISASVKECHATADQVFRAVHESWESTTGYRPQATVRAEADPSGGSDATDGFPSWAGIGAGAERLVGLLEFLAAYLKAPTKAAVTIPLGELLDLTSRITLVTLPTGGKEDSAEMNVAIGREEKAELWSVLPDIHTAVVRLHTTIIHRLQNNALSLSTDLLDQMVRVFNSSHHVASVRENTYTLAREILLLSGPGLGKLTVDSLSSVILGCCQDILRTSGHSEDSAREAPVASTKGGTKPKESASTGNADAFLANAADLAAPVSTSLPKSHRAAAAELLPLFLSHLPQRHLSPDARGLIDRTAILSNNKAAMLASCLHPFKDSRGRYYPSILPFLIRQFPHDQGVEVLRSNLLRGGGGAAAQQAWDPREGLDDLLRDREAEVLLAEDNIISLEGADISMVSDEDSDDNNTNGWGEYLPQTISTAAGAVANQFLAVADQIAPARGLGGHDATSQRDPSLLTPLKRKGDQIESGSSTKRGKAQDNVGIAYMPKPAAPPVVAEEDEKDSDSDDDNDDDAASIEIDMTLDDEDDEEEEEEDGEEGEDSKKDE